MKTYASETYYQMIWDDMLNKRQDMYYLNLEEELDRYTATVKNKISDEAYKTVRKAYAEKVIEKAEMLCREMMKTVKQYKKNECSFGYTTEGQELSAWFKFQKRFEFNCYQLAVFKKAYK